MELIFLSALITSREFFNKSSDFINRNDLSTEGALIYDHIKSYYDNDPKVPAVNKHIILGRLKEKLNEKHFDLIKDIVQGLDPNISIPNVMDLCTDIKINSLKWKLATKLQSHEDPRELMEELSGLMSNGLQEESQAELYNGATYDDVLESYEDKNLIALRPKSLNDKLDGGVVPETHIILYGRPEIGKSMLAIHNAVYQAFKGKTVLYVGNEDPHTAIRMRFLLCATGVSRKDLMDDPELIRKRKAALKNLFMYSASPGSIPQIQNIVNRIKADVLIIDQLRNLKPRNADTRVVQLEQLASDARSLTKKNGLVTISVTQAGDSAEGKAILGMSDIDFSKTGIPAQADIMIGFGGSDDDVANNYRYLSLCKNKRNGVHGALRVKVQPEISRVVDL